MRDITEHRYQTLSMEDVYNSAIIDYPQMKDKLQNILKNEKEE